jgi:chaperonin GroEL
MKEKKARIEDALHATRAAVEEGIVPGGGVALLRCIPALDDVKAAVDEATGVDIVRRALRSPITQIAENAGADGAVICDKVLNEARTVGFNAATGQIEDLVKAGIVDPTKVVRVALENAASVATLLLTTEAVITDAPEKEKDED